MSKSSSVSGVLRSISDDISLDLYKSIANSNGERGDDLLAKTKITRKQYYSRLSTLIKAGLIKRKNGRYSLTAFGRVVHESEKSIENAFNIYWKLKAVDSIGFSNDIPKEEYSKIVDALIDSYKIKDILTNRDKAKQTAGQFRTSKSTGATNNHVGANVEKIRSL
jgi:DNA-binding HxlR family transcriptional regulator